MAAPKGNKYGVGGKGGGRPSKYKPEYAEQAYGIALLGATDAGVAEVFGVNVSTIDRWKREHKAFSTALKNGKQAADSKVQKSLFSRANGYEFTEKKTTKRKVGEVTTVEHTETVKHVAADTTAGIFWLKNRQPDQWREKKVVEHEGGISLENDYLKAVQDALEREQ